MNIKQLKLYAVVARNDHGRLVIVSSRRMPLMVYARRSEAIAARVEEADGDATLLAGWKIVSFSADGPVTTKHKKETEA